MPSNFMKTVYRAILFISFCLPFQSAIANSDSSSELRLLNEAFLANASATIAGTKLRNSKLVTTFYAENAYTPIWTTENKSSNKLQSLLREIKASQSHGVHLSNYHFDVISKQSESPSIVEILATDAFISQVKHRTLGVVSPQQIEPSWFLPAKEVDALAVLKKVIANDNIEKEMQSLWPLDSEYWLLIEKRASLVNQGDDEIVEIPSGKALKKDTVSERVTKLKQRLKGPGNYSQEFDDELEKLVKAFQLSNGLEPDGIVGTGTIQVLNASNSVLIDRIDANLERWRWLPNKTPSDYIRVNIASFQLRLFKDDVQQLKMDVIVGKPYRKTPLFTESMKYMVVNPYWNVPFKIATQDKLLVLKSDPSKLDLLGFEAKAANSDVFEPVSNFNWANVSSRNFDYFLRQKPGPMNALGTIKFMLPNPHSVYLHDTPDHSLFLKKERSFSSGCIRLSEPSVLAEWILNNDNQSNLVSDLNNALQGNQTQTLYLKKPLTVLIVYFTAFKDDKDQIVFRPDIYSRDEPIIVALENYRSQKISVDSQIKIENKS